MMLPSLLFLGCWCCWISPIHASDNRRLGNATLISLTAQSFHQGTLNGLFDVVADVRTQAEWVTTGHIQGATLLETLPQTDANGAKALLGGCEYCDIAVYDSTGARALQAIQVLMNAGFQGNLYNGLGTEQWLAAGLPLVTTDTTSVAPACTVDPVASKTCQDKWFGHNIPGVKVSLPAARSEATAASTSAFPVLSTEEIHSMTQNGTFGVILDVRTEWDWATTGRLPNSTILSSLINSTGSLNGCEYCNIVVYGNTLTEVEQALNALVVSQFKGQLYNGQTVGDYEMAGYSLVLAPSVIPACVAGDASCYSAWKNAQPTTTAPSLSPSATKPVKLPTSNRPGVSAIQSTSSSSSKASIGLSGASTIGILLAAVIVARP
jgi:rhodanese-related sulfurtransferase